MTDLNNIGWQDNNDGQGQAYYNATTDPKLRPVSIMEAIEDGIRRAKERELSVSLMYAVSLDDDTWIRVKLKARNYVHGAFTRKTWEEFMFSDAPFSFKNIYCVRSLREGNEWQIIILKQP